MRLRSAVHFCTAVSPSVCFKNHQDQRKRPSSISIVKTRVKMIKIKEEKKRPSRERRRKKKWIRREKRRSMRSCVFFSLLSSGRCPAQGESLVCGLKNTRYYYTYTQCPYHSPPPPFPQTAISHTQRFPSGALNTGTTTNRHETDTAVACKPPTEDCS